MSYIFRTEEPLGAELKTVSRYVIGALIFIEIWRGKEVTKKRNYHMDIGVMASFTNKMMVKLRGKTRGTQKWLPMFVLFLTVYLLQIGCLKLQCILVLGLLLCFKPIQKDYVSTISRSW